MPRNLYQMAIKKRIMTAKVIGYMKPDIDPNTRLYVPFNEGVGDLAKDYSQYGNHAQLTDVKWSSDGFNGAGKFNGSSSYGDCGNDASLNITGAISIEARMKFKAIDCFNYIFSKDDHRAATRDRGYYLNIMDSNRLRMLIGIDSATAAFKTGTETSFVVDELYYIKGVYDSSDQTITLYINGTEEPGTTTGTVPSAINSNNVEGIVGSQLNVSTPMYSNGTIHTIIINSTAKTAAQAAADCYEVVCN